MGKLGVLKKLASMGAVGGTAAGVLPLFAKDEVE
jgi:hypothetical protein